MGIAATAQHELQETLDRQAGQSEPHWYAAYTCANHEKRVAEQMAERSLDFFLPQYRSVRRWKDRRVELEMPLFPGYIFVHMELRERLRVLEVPSVVRLVGFGGRAAALPDEQITRLRSGLEPKLRPGPHPYLTVGRRMRILRGALEGMEGILLRCKGSIRVVLTLELILRSISVEVDAADIAPAA